MRALLVLPSVSSVTLPDLPAPRPRAQLTFNEFNHLEQIEQEGWLINYSDPRQYTDISLPRRIEISRGEDDIKLVFVGLNWTLDQ